MLGGDRQDSPILVGATDWTQVDKAWASGQAYSCQRCGGPRGYALRYRLSERRQRWTRTAPFSNKVCVELSVCDVDNDEKLGHGWLGAEGSIRSMRVGRSEKDREPVPRSVFEGD